MTLTKSEALHLLANAGDDSYHHLPKNELNQGIEVLQEVALNHGLPEYDLDKIIRFLTTNKLAASTQVNLLNCLIPETTISKCGLNEILLWFFNGVASQTLAHNVQEKFLQWLLAIAYYELSDPTSIDFFYYSFIFLMKLPHVESSVCSLLCLISKPEHAKRWTVQQVLKLQSVSGPKKHTNAFLSLMKSFRADIVPEEIPVSTFHPKTSWHLNNLKKAHTRKLEKASRLGGSNDSEGLQFNTWKIFDRESINLEKLIPSPNIEKGPKIKSYFSSMRDITSLSPIDIENFDKKYPQGLASMGYHLLAYSDTDTKTRFSHKLYHTLWKVFLLDLEPFSEPEKISFLSSLEGFLVFIHQSIPVVTDFLLNYLLIWDGHSYQKQIFKLVEWIQVRNEKDLEMYVFFPLRQIFVSSGTECKCLVIKTMGNLMRNLIAMDKKESYFFANEFLEMNAAKAIESVGRFVSGLASNALIWNNEEKTRNILISCLDFYELAQAVEQAGDLPLLILMPPILVYKCLFSESVFLIARICSLLVSLFKVSVERLYALGVSEDFSADVEILKIYILDAYRCLWGHVGFSKEHNSFLFNDDVFLTKFSKLKEIYGPSVNKIFSVEHLPVFWSPTCESASEVQLKLLTNDFPSILMLKDIVEQRILQKNGKRVALLPKNIQE